MEINFWLRPLLSQPARWEGDRGGGWLGLSVLANVKIIKDNVSSSHQPPPAQHSHWLINQFCLLDISPDNTQSKSPYDISTSKERVSKEKIVIYSWFGSSRLNVPAFMQFQVTLWNTSGDATSTPTEEALQKLQHCSSQARILLNSLRQFLGYNELGLF